LNLRESTGFYLLPAMVIAIMANGRAHKTKGAPQDGTPRCVQFNRN
jgi:hypothetical protein